jgi:DtxR family Mn-dependent transcriptional regulator
LAATSLKANLEITVNEGRYLKFLYRKQREEASQIGTTALAEAFKVKPATVTETLQKLSEKELLRYTRYHGTELTKKGIIEAEKLLRKHRILEVLFVRLLNYSAQKACEEATELDHHVSKKLANAICQAYSHPEVCPCDKSIFKDRECCEVRTSDLSKEL